MLRKITPATTLENLKKEAKRWLKDLRQNDAEALQRLHNAWPAAPAKPVLRDVHYALAREYEQQSWTELKQALSQRTAAPPDNHAQIVARFLECACPDHHVRSLPAHRMASHAAMRFLEQNPGIARDSIYTAVVCGEIEEVDRLLREQPDLARKKRPVSGHDRSGSGGSYDFLGELGGKDWDPLLYLCFTRLPLPRTNDNAVAIARLLLDRGADPNGFFMAGDSHYTPLTGVIGEGEEGRPPHPRRDELVRLLLEHGANPYDGQVIYNINFRGKILWWVKLMYEFSVKAGRSADWDDPEWHMLDQGGYGSGARWHLRTAIEHNDLELAEWCLAHGANPNAAPERDQRFPQRSLYEHAVRKGREEIAGLLARHGAERVEVALDDEERYVSGCLRLDRDEVQRILAQHPEYLQSTKAIFAAAEQDRADAVEFLLDRGTPIEVEDDQKQRALHVAAANDAVHVAGLLIQRGAEVDPYELRYSNTPFDFAAHYQHTRMIELLTRHSRDVWNLTPAGAVERLREVLSAEPRLATISWQTTPLFWLPEDEEQALEIVRIFLAHGADPKFRGRRDGMTAAAVARRRGMQRAAALLDAAAGGAVDEERARREYMLNLYEQLARDVVTVMEDDDQEALDRLGRHYNRIVTFEFVRDNIRRRLESTTIDLAGIRELIARQEGFAGWTALIESFAPAAPPASSPARANSVDAYQSLAQDFVNAYETRDAAALQRLNDHYHRSFTFDDLSAEIWRRNYAFRQRSSRVPKNYLWDPLESTCRHASLSIL